MLDLAMYLKKKGIACGDYRSNKLYISPEGYLKVYPLDMESGNQHSAYYKALAQRSEIEGLILTPE